jgi:hypothetical protein
MPPETICWAAPSKDRERLFHPSGRVEIASARKRDGGGRSPAPSRGHQDRQAASAVVCRDPSSPVRSNLGEVCSASAQEVW